MLSNEIIESHNIKYVFVESGKLAIREKCEEVGIAYNPEWKFFVELSIGSEEDEFDKAWNNFGATFDEAMAWPLSQIKQFFGISTKEDWKLYLLTDS